MGLTRRQSEAIQQMIIQESREAYASQQERHRILGEVDGDDDDLVVEGSGGVELPIALRHAIVDLIEAFYTNNRIYEGCEFDNGLAAKRATEYLFRLVEADVKETVDMLQAGDFDGMDQESMPSPSGGGGGSMGSGGGGGSSPPPSMDQDDDVELPPMHPRASGKPGGVTGGSGKVTVGGPAKHVSALSDEPRGGGYPGGGGDDVELPPMHPRGRK